MRLHLGGTVVFLDRRQLTIIVGILVAILFVGSWILPSGARRRNDDVYTFDDEPPQPVPIETVLRRRRADPAVADDAGRAPAQHDVVVRRRPEVERPPPPPPPNVAAADREPIVMAMDGARQKRGSVIAAARQRLISGQRRAPDSRYNINVTLSDMTSVDRALPDTRPPVCRSTFASVYGDPTLPPVTVIIPYYNEALTMILRAVHSVLNRSPNKLLDEIILVDDCSTDADLQKPLSDYVRLLPKVRLVRHDHRQGLIVSRMDGARMARSPVLFFMDAHAEVNDGWLEPLLAQLKHNPKQILQPFIDGIDAMTLSFGPPGVYHKGTFSWDLRYTWTRMKDHEQEQVIETGVPFFTPTLVGCAIAVQRDYFLNLGSFDEGMKVWGGENIELAFRAWMCGGQVKTVTCSRVGHVFKEFPYQFDGNKEEIVQKNLIRVAETWMDGMRKYFYASTRIYEFKRAQITDPDEVASLEERKRLRTRLGCHNFEWYLYNVIPEYSIPPMEAAFHGEIKSLRTQACWVVTPDYYVTITYVCYHHKVIPENHFSLTGDGLLRYFDRCVDSPQPPYLQLVECSTPKGHLASWWELKRTGTVWGSLVFHQARENGSTVDWCITQVTNAMPRYRGDQMPQLLHCNDADEFQQWSFTYGFDFSQVPEDAMR